MNSISVILPVFNVKKYILRCLDSIILQTFHDFELIVIDDCGADESIKLCKSTLANSTIRYRIIHNKKNIGVSESRRIGVENSKAKYVLFVDSDDWLHPNALEKLYEVAETENADFVSAM